MKEEISYESLIAGLLLKFDLIDNVDFSLLVEDFQNKTGIKVYGIQNPVDFVYNYAQFQNNGTVSLKKSILNNQTSRGTLSNFTDNKVIEYISSLDIEKYKIEKEKAKKKEQRKSFK